MKKIYFSANIIFFLVSSSVAQQNPAVVRAGVLENEIVNVPKPGTKETVEAEMGNFAVNENRKKENSRVIKIAFLRFKSNDPKTKIPAVYLDGGPGVSGINSTLGNMFYPLQQLRDAGDVIVIDHRGVGFSEPTLKCADLFAETDSVSLKEQDFHNTLAANSVYNAGLLSKQGYDLPAYNVTESANDVYELVKALGYHKINLIGYSYGSHWALAFMKQHPSFVNKIILVGPAGRELQKLPADLESQLNKISQLAKNDPAINKKIPDLYQLLRSELIELRNNPVDLPIIHPKTKKTITVTVDDFTLRWLTAAFLGRRDFIQVMPLLYYSLEQKNYSILSALLARLMARPAESAIQYTVRCSSGVSYDRLYTIVKQGDETLLGNSVNFPWPEICVDWNINDMGDKSRDMKKYAAPALLISGTLDVNAPASNVADIANHFRSKSYLQLKNSDHDDYWLQGKNIVVPEIIKFLTRDEGNFLKEAETEPIKFLPIGN